MRRFSQFLSLLFHPMLIPCAGVLAYFRVSPRFEAPGQLLALLVPIGILTVAIPLTATLILKKFGIFEGRLLRQPVQRHYSLLLGIGLCSLVLFRILGDRFALELYFYFVGLIAALLTALIALLLQLRLSFHMLGMGSLIMFLVALSIHFERNIVIAISLCTLGCGLLATSRLYLQPHRKVEVLIGFLIGVLTQLFTLRFWL